MTNNHSEENPDSKPYQLIPFSGRTPHLESPAGHSKFKGDLLHGNLFLNLTVKTALHISTGIVVLGTDVGKNSIPLIKTMTQDMNNSLIIQGSSLKGCIRSVYEAITNSTLGVITNKYDSRIPRKYLPFGHRNSLCSLDELCPASRVFGAMGWQGLIEFTDAKYKEVSSVGFMPSLNRPRPEINDEGKKNPIYFNEEGKVRGRKFYYNTNRAIDKGKDKGIPVQQAKDKYIFTTKLQFKNLKPEELGTLFIVLGLDDNYPLALKVGAGKPVGFGTIKIEVTEANIFQNKQDLKNRYSNYTPPESNNLTGTELKEFITQKIADAHNSNLLDKNLLAGVAEVLEYPTNREPKEGNY
ncbi:RAMP superfamily CRISPR-associated protein [Dapis sp. BLCC M172]|uniref:RAMP superfamily CRISPR-associated protein n=1 Tax=Dapis sp. BLCC M172 TaxID=2975281 RepID=UPI003CEA65F3